MLPTIIISAVLAAIVVWIIYGLVRDARSGRGGCAGCHYADTCAAAKIPPKKTDCGCPEQQRAVH